LGELRVRGFREKSSEEFGKRWVYSYSNFEYGTECLIFFLKKSKIFP